MDGHRHPATKQGSLAMAYHDHRQVLADNPPVRAGGRVWTRRIRWSIHRRLPFKPRSSGREKRVGLDRDD